MNNAYDKYGVKISIIIPCYNASKYIERCLNSVFKQTCLPYQINLINDCSKDDTAEKVTKINQSSPVPIQLINNEKNMGPGYGRQVGIDTAEDGYLCFMDSDDWIEPNLIEDLCETIRKDGSDLIIYNNYITTKDGTQKVGHTIDGIVSGNKHILLAKYGYSLWRISCKKELFSNLIHSKYKHLEDAVLVYQLLLKCKNYSILDQCYYNYFSDNSSSLSKNPSKDTYSDAIHTFDIIRSYFSDEYKKELEFIGIKIVLISAVINALSASCSAKEIRKICTDFQNDFPNWYNNDYIKDLPSGNKKLLSQIQKKQFLKIKLSYSLHFLLAKFYHRIKY